jgi:hypothetical protein
MKEIPKHFTLKDEGPHHYTIHDSRDGKTFPIAKHALDLSMHGTLSKIQKFDEGTTDVEPKDFTPGTDYSKESLPGDVNSSTNTYQSAFDPGAGDTSIDVALRPENWNRSQADISSEMSANQPTNSTPVADASLPTQSTAPDSGPVQSDLPPRGTNTQETKATAPIPGSADSTLQQQAKAQEASNAIIQKAMSDFQENKTDLDKDWASLHDAVLNNDIDPNRWMNRNGAWGKLSSGLGIILGGIGAGLQHSNVNQALQFINQQISNDIDAQKANLGKTQSLLSMNRQRYHDDSTAIQVTANQQAALVAGQLNAMALKDPNTAAQKRATAQLLANQVSQSNLGIARQQALMKMMGAAGQAPGSEEGFQSTLNAAQFMDPEWHKDLQSKYVPSVGVASVPLSDDDRKQLTNFTDIQRFSKEAADFRQNVSGSAGNWTPAVKKQGEQIQGNLIDSLSQLKNSNRPESKEIYDRYASELGNINSTDFMGGNAASLKQLQSDVATRFNTLAQQKGLRPFAGSQPPQLTPQQQELYKWAKANPQDNRSAVVLKKLGV